MMRFVESPNLPHRAVARVIIGERYRKVLEEPLRSLDVTVIWMPENRHVDFQLASHVDLSMIHTGGANIIAAKNIVTESPSLVKILTNEGLSVTTVDVEQRPRYPLDAGFNICVHGKFVFYNPKSALIN
jgi:hypothetical protein